MHILERKVLELIGENPDSPDVFTDDSEGMAQIRDSLNDAIQEITLVTGGHKRKYYIPLRQDVGFYRFRLSNGELGWITDVWSVNRQYRLEQTDLLRLTVHDPRWMIHSGEPEAYLPIGKEVIGFYPKPSGDTNVVEITVVEIPAEYEDGADRVKLKDSFQFAAVHYAVGEYWASRGDAKEATTYGVMYLDALGLKHQFLPASGYISGQNTLKEPWPTVTA